MKIAIVEDEIRIREGIEKLLVKLNRGYEVIVTAENAGIARRMREAKPGSSSFTATPTTTGALTICTIDRNIAQALTWIVAPASSHTIAGVANGARSVEQAVIVTESATSPSAR